MALTDDPNNTAPSHAGDTQIDRAPRMRVLKRGKILFENGTRSYPVTVRNISETGARIQLSDPQAVPLEFVLQVDLDNFRVSCRRVWDEGLLYGIEFTGEKQSLGHEPVQQAVQSAETIRSSFRTYGMTTSSNEATTDNTPGSGVRRPSKPSFGRRGG